MIELYHLFVQYAEKIFEPAWEITLFGKQTEIYKVPTIFMSVLAVLLNISIAIENKRQDNDQDK
jgi:hypothetical protein